MSNLFKVALHGFVGQQQHGAHQVSHQYEVSFGLQVQSHDVVVMVALSPQLFLSRPLVQTDLKQTAEVVNRLLSRKLPGGGRSAISLSGV